MIWPFSHTATEELGAETLGAEHTRGMADIHAQTFAHAWTDGEFQDFLHSNNVGGIALCEPKARGGAVVGFVLLRIVEDEAEVLTIAVAPSWQKKGVGRRLVDMTLANLRLDGIGSLFLEVNETNTNAIALYKRVGFQEVAKRENYYRMAQGQKAHALVMRRDVS